MLSTANNSELEISMHYLGKWLVRAKLKLCKRFVQVDRVA